MVGFRLPAQFFGVGHRRGMRCAGALLASTLLASACFAQRQGGTADVSPAVDCPASLKRDVRELLVFGDFLLVEGETANTVVYRLSDEAKLGAVYGMATFLPDKKQLLVLSAEQKVYMFNMAALAAAAGDKK